MKHLPEYILMFVGMGTALVGYVMTLMADTVQEATPCIVAIFVGLAAVIGSLNLMGSGR